MAIITSELETLLSTATVACQASFQESGFRQRNLRFYFELFREWASWDRSAPRAELQTTQFTRFLNELVREGHAKCVTRAPRSPYLLTRLGLIELLTRISQRNEAEPHHTFLFAFYFLRAYRDRLIRLVTREGSDFPTALQIELEALLDYRSLLSTKIKSLQKSIRKIKAGIENAESSSALSQNLFHRGIALEEIVREVEQKFPYEFHAEKPLHELIAEIPEEAKQWELETGNALRAKLLWKPALSVEQEFLRQLQQIEASLPQGANISSR
ncbi:hypothetical protein MRY87_03395 [bacterium]|nr:hypothetical protein [bacterium]